MSARPSPHRDAAVLASMQARSRLDAASKIYSAKRATDRNARLAMALIEIIEPTLRAVEGILRDPLTKAGGE